MWCKTAGSISQLHCLGLGRPEEIKTSVRLLSCPPLSDIRQDVFALLEFYTALFDSLLPTFRHILQVPSSRANLPDPWSWDSVPKRRQLTINKRRVNIPDNRRPRFRRKPEIAHSKGHFFLQVPRTLSFVLLIRVFVNMIMSEESWRKGNDRRKLRCSWETLSKWALSQQV